MSFDDFTFINLEHLIIQSIYSKYLFHIDLPNLTTLLFGQYFAKEMITDFTISHFNQLKSLFIGPGALQKVTKFTISNNPILETIIFASNLQCGAYICDCVWLAVKEVEISSIIVI